MDNEKVTVLIIKNDINDVSSFQILAKHVDNFHRYIKLASVFVIVFVVCLLGLISYMFYLHGANKDLNIQLSDANKQIDMVTAQKVKEKLANIDSRLSVIHDYLLKRGALETGSEGGENSNKDDEDVYAKVGFYEEQSEIFFNSLENIPLGRPFDGPMSSGYGYRTNPFGGRSGEFHPGVDFKGQIGDPIYATGSGIVARCDWYNGYGNAVVITHKSGLQTLYGHMSRVNVVQNQKITAGDLIGFIGTTGRSTGPHVHYEIRKDGADIDPVPFLKLN